MNPKLLSTFDSILEIFFLGLEKLWHVIMMTSSMQHVQNEV
jgi:hypothetical protein